MAHLIIQNSIFELLKPFNTVEKLQILNMVITKIDSENVRKKKLVATKKVGKK